MATVSFFAGLTDMNMKLFQRSAPPKGGGAPVTLIDRVTSRLGRKPVAPVQKSMSPEMSSIWNILVALQDGKRDLETWMTGVSAVWDSVEMAKDVEQVREWGEAVDQGIERMRTTLMENDVTLPPPSKLDTNPDRTAARNLAAGALQAHCAFLHAFFVKKDVGYLQLSRTSKYLPMALVRIAYAAQFRRISPEKVRSAALPSGLADARTMKRLGATTDSQDRAIALAAQQAASGVTLDA